MELEADLFEVLFFVSLTVNVCAWMHFGIFALIDKLVAKESQIRITRLRLAHKHNTAFMRNFYLDAVIFTCIPIATVVLTFTTGVLERPFVAYFPNELRLLFSVVCGVYIFLLFRCCMLVKSSPVKYVNIIIYTISLSTALTVLISSEDATIGLVLIVSTSDTVLLNTVKLFDHMRIQRGTRKHKLVLFAYVYACLVFRACLPLACIAVSLINGRPFDMSYPSICFFFIGILFFGVINTWQVNVAISRLCCREREIIVEVPYRQFGNGSEPKPEDVAVASSSIEMPPSYIDVFGNNSYLPVVLPVASSSGAAVTRDISSNTCSNLDIDIANDRQAVQINTNERTIESSSNNASLV